MGTAEGPEVLNQPALSSDALTGPHATAVPPCQVSTQVTRDRTGVNEGRTAAHAQFADGFQAISGVSQDSHISPAQLPNSDTAEAVDTPQLLATEDQQASAAEQQLYDEDVAGFSPLTTLDASQVSSVTVSGPGCC